MLVVWGFGVWGLCVGGLCFGGLWFGLGVFATCIIVCWGFRSCEPPLAFAIAIAATVNLYSTLSSVQ